MVAIKENKTLFKYTLVSSIAFAILAHIPGIGWMTFECAYAPLGGPSCGGFVPNKILWGPFGWNIMQLGGSAPSIVGFVFTVGWWIMLGSITSYILIKYLLKRK